MATKKQPATKTFQNNAKGREQAVKQAKKQGEPSVTFKLGKQKEKCCK